MSEIEKNKAVLRAFVQAVWIEGRLDRLAEFWTEDCINHAAPPSLDKGLAALSNYHQQMGSIFASFSDIRINIVRQVAEADQVVTHIVTTAKHTGNFMGIAGVGKPVSLATIRIDRLRNGKIAEHWSVADMAGLMQQLQS